MGNPNAEVIILQTSIWRENINFAPRASLSGSISVDAVVIGAGLAGTLTAYFLKKQGLDTVVLESGRIGGGQTQNTTAKITSQHSLVYHDLIEKFGIEKARQYAEANQGAIESYKEIISQHNIDCDFEEKPAYVYTLKNLKKIEDEAAAAQKLLLPAEFTTKTALPFAVKGAVRFSRQAQFNPLKFLKGIAKDLTIYENTPVTSVENHMAVTPYGKVTAKSIVVAAHYPFINVPGFYFLKMYQQRSYVIALKNAADVQGMYIDEADGGFSFRNYKELMLFGGSGHRCGENSTGQAYENLLSAARQFYPGCAEQARWSAQDCMTLDKVPYIGHYCLTTPDLYVATGFQKWGMTTSMAAAQILSDLIVKNRSPYQEIFSPQRFNLSASARRLAENTAQAFKGLNREFLKPPASVLSDLLPGHGGIIEYNGEKIGAYKEDNGAVHMVSTRCAHLGCQLEWNPDELTWDCPCHGSRFDYYGNLIDNPALHDIKI